MTGGGGPCNSIPDHRLHTFFGQWIRLCDACTPQNLAHTHRSPATALPSKSLLLPSSLQDDSPIPPWTLHLAGALLDDPQPGVGRHFAVIAAHINSVITIQCISARIWKMLGWCPSGDIPHWDQTPKNKSPWTNRAKFQNKTPPNLKIPIRAKRWVQI